MTPGGGAPVNLTTASAQIQAYAARAQYDRSCSRARLRHALAKATKRSPVPLVCLLVGRYRRLQAEFRSVADALARDGHVARRMR
jgi:hypothetical protein